MRTLLLHQSIFRGRQPLLIGLLLYLLARLSFSVENGQFEREYSRIYAGLVFALAIILTLLLILLLLWPLYLITIPTRSEQNRI